MMLTFTLRPFGSGVEAGYPLFSAYLRRPARENLKTSLVESLSFPGDRNVSVVVLSDVVGVLDICVCSIRSIIV